MSVSQDRKRLLFVVNVDWFFLSHRLPIALEAIRSGYEVHIATGLTTRLDDLLGYGLIVHSLSLDRSSTSIFSTAKTFWEIFRLFNHIRPDVVHLVTIKPAIFGGLAARLANVPAVVVAVSGLGFVFVARGFNAALRRVFVSLLYRLSLGHANLRVIFQNIDDKNSLMQVAKLAERDTAMIAGSGVDLDEYIALPLATGLPVVMLAARLLADKGVREFVQAARALKAISDPEKPIARFVLVGDIDRFNPTSISSVELQHWKAEGVVEVWGHQDEMVKCLPLAHIVVLPSYYGEGLPKVLIEAAACGRAVVTTDHPGCREAIEPDISGLLVPIRDSASLASAIKKILDDPGYCRRMGLAGRNLAERSFCVKKVVATHMSIYSDLLTKARSLP
jgi:glycosyltransferase involved in cell wall biosynthesis